MTDLFEMLGLGEVPDVPQDDPLSGGPEEARRRREHANPNAVVVDRWAHRRGLDLLNDEPGLEPEVDGHAAADFSALAFEVRPKLTEGCFDPLKARFVAELVDTEDYREAHRRSMLDAPAAALAALEFAKAFRTLKRDNPDGVPDDYPGDRQVARAAAQAAGQAAEEVNAYADTCAACGADPTCQNSKLDPQAAARIYRRVKNSRSLKRIMELAGAYRRLAQGKQRLKESHPIGEVVDLTLGGEVERMTASELGRFAVPGTTLDQYRRVLQRQALVREHRTETPAGRGPVVVVVDESGSMNGDRIEQAKGLALALAWVAREQKRWCCFYSFGCGTATRKVVLPPGRWDELAVLDWLSGFMCAGGTDLDVLCKVVPADWDALAASGMARGRTDVVLITDGQMPAPDNLPDYLIWKAREKARVVSVVIGMSPEAFQPGAEQAGYGGVPAVSDEVHAAFSLNAASGAAAAAVNVG